MDRIKFMAAQIDTRYQQFDLTEEGKQGDIIIDEQAKSLYLVILYKDETIPKPETFVPFLKIPVGDIRTFIGKVNDLRIGLSNTIKCPDEWLDDNQKVRIYRKGIME